MKIPLYKVYTDAEDVRRVSKVVRRGNYWSIGPEIKEYEDMTARYVGRRHGVSFNSGTSALHAMMLAAGIGAGDEVIVPSFSFIATANCVLFVGAKPCFADVEEQTYGLDVDSVRDRITDRTKAIIPTHVGGLACRDITKLKDLAKERNLLMLEDAAEAVGSIAYGQKAGSFGDAAILSFCGNKVISTGEGGMVLTDSDDLRQKLELVRSHGRLDRLPYFSTSESAAYVRLGYNWRVSSMTAALGIAQTNKIEKVIGMRRRIAKRFSKFLGSIPGVKTPAEPDGFRHAYQMYIIEVGSGKARRDMLREHMTSRSITTKIYFEPIHLTHFYKSEFGYGPGLLPVTESLSERVLTLPIYPTMTKREQDYLLKAASDFFSKD